MFDISFIWIAGSAAWAYSLHSILFIGIPDKRPVWPEDMACFDQLHFRPRTLADLQ